MRTVKVTEKQRELLSLIASREVVLGTNLSVEPGKVIEPIQYYGAVTEALTPYPSGGIRLQSGSQSHRTLIKNLVERGAFVMSDQAPHPGVRMRGYTKMLDLSPAYRKVFRPKPWPWPDLKDDKGVNSAAWLILWYILTHEDHSLWAGGRGSQNAAPNTLHKYITLARHEPGKEFATDVEGLAHYFTADEVNVLLADGYLTYNPDGDTVKLKNYDAVPYVKLEITEKARSVVDVAGAVSFELDPPARYVLDTSIIDDLDFVPGRRTNAR